jgi:hypothetical protein
VYTRKWAFLHPLLRHQLRYHDLERNRHAPPGPRHWHDVCAVAGAFEHARAHPECGAELRAQTALWVPRLVRLAWSRLGGVVVEG